MTEDRQFPPGSRVVDLDLSGVHLHGAVLEGARLTDAYLVGADISGDIEGVRINDVEVEPLVRAELDRRFPERVALRSDEVLGLRAAWSMLEGLWTATYERATNLGEDQLSLRVDGEWSFVETIRHLILATDCWLFRGIQLARHPYHPWGLAGFDPELWEAVGLDASAQLSFAQVLPVRREHQLAVRSQLERLTDSELTQIRSAPDEPGHPTGEHSVLQCLHVIMNEEWEHHRYATRDLDTLEGSAAGQA